MIKSVDGDNSIGAINKFINGMLARIVKHLEIM
jgi:hypothetical protein